MIKIEHFLDEVVIPTLKELDMYSEEACLLVVGTAIQESRLHYLKQIPSGIAKGVCQMEEATHDDIWDNFLAYKPEIKAKVMGLANPTMDLVDQLKGNLYYSVAMCRVHYYRVSEALPSDLKGMAKYWKKYYNTPLGAVTEEEFIHNYEKAVK
jgi:hypothetical protein